MTGAASEPPAERVKPAAPNETTPAAKARALLAIGVGLVAGGIIVVGTVGGGGQLIGGVIVLAGWLLLVVALHRFGRSGSVDQKLL